MKKKMHTHNTQILSVTDVRCVQRFLCLKRKKDCGDARLWRRGANDGARPALGWDSFIVKYVGDNRHGARTGLRSTPPPVRSIVNETADDPGIAPLRFVGGPCVIFPVSHA